MTEEQGGSAGAGRTVRLTWAQALAWRMERHGLVRRAGRDGALEIAGRICGLHAQVMSSAELSLWARVEGLEPDAVQRALWEERTLVKTWAMRGTLHLLPAAEFPLWQAALSTYRHYLRGAWLRYFGVTRQELEQVLEAIARALDGRALTRDELAEEVARLTGSAALGEKLRESWGAMLKPAAFRGQLCFAPSAGQSVRFTRPDGWLGGWQPEDPDAALAGVVRRYLGAYGPAAPEDLARWWSGLSPARAEALIRGLGDEVVRVDLEGRPAWMLAEHAQAAAGASPSGAVRLLPAFDPYVAGAPRDAPAVLPPAFKGRVYRPQGWLSPVLLVDGRVAGVWTLRRKGRRLTVRIEPFADPAEGVRRAAGEEAERLAAFLDGTLELTWAA